MKTLLSLILVAFGLLFTSTASAANDPLKVAPNVYKLLFENDRIRVMEVTFKPGEKIGEHSHPDHFVTVLEAGKLKIFKPDGSSQEIQLKQKEVVWIPAETHWSENTGPSVVKLLVTELKDGGTHGAHAAH